MSMETKEYTFTPCVGAAEDRYRQALQFVNGLVECNPGRFIMPSRFQHEYKNFLDMEVRQDDIWVISFPKCGTTWTQEMVWLIANGLDYRKAQQNIEDRFPFLELSCISDYEDYEAVISKVGDTFQKVLNMPSPRFIKSHLCRDYLPRQLWTVKPKIIYVSRNPKDAAVSFFHHHRLLEDYLGTFQEFLECFRKEKAMYCSYWENVLPFWNMRDEPNILFLKYEDMKKDLKAVIQRVSKFLNNRILTEEELEKLERHLSFEEMKQNPHVNLQSVLPKDDLQFIRKGQVGDWRNYLSQEQVEDFNRWIDENLDGTALDFVDENKI